MDTLLTDLFQAYYDARRNKRNTHSQLHFELNLETNLIALYRDLRNRSYSPSPSVCFVVCDSVKREVFASDFRDRVVHHLYYNYVASLLDRQFVFDSYSCRKGKGTLMGIERLEHHIRSASRNYTREAYILQLDISGYFMSIDRKKLCTMVHEMTDRVQLSPEQRSLVDYLTDIITLKDPLLAARFKGRRKEWDGLPPSKCLSCSPPGVGLPIGDLTSQLYSNIFLNRLDQYMTRTLGFRRYGRYVDDFYIVDSDRERLRAAIPKIVETLALLGLCLHSGKTRLLPVSGAVRFLGAVLHPHYRHCAPRTMRKFAKYSHAFNQLTEWDGAFDVERCVSTMNSYCGYLSHYKAARVVLSGCCAGGND